MVEDGFVRPCDEEVLLRLVGYLSELVQLQNDLQISLFEGVRPISGQLSLKDPATISAVWDFRRFDLGETISDMTECHAEEGEFMALHGFLIVAGW